METPISFQAKVHSKAYFKSEQIDTRHERGLEKVHSKAYFNSERCWYSFLVLVLVIFLSACEIVSCSQDFRFISITSYNVHNLFDDKIDGTEYSDFSPASPLWNTKKYLDRLSRLARVIQEIWPKGPDLIVLNEIENLQVITDLHQMYLHRLGYSSVTITRDPNSAIQTGLISKFPILSSRSLGSQSGQFLNRSVLEAEIDLGGTIIRVFASHWKSKAGAGARDTEEARIASARVIRGRYAELQKTNPLEPVIIIGDLNSQWNENLTSAGEYETALHFLECSEPMPSRGILFTTACAGSLGDFSGLPVFFTPWPGWIDSWRKTTEGVESEVLGSYRFQGNWEGIDHFLLNSQAYKGDDLGFYGFLVGAFPHLIDSNLQPVGYNVRTGWGFSDHLPILLILEQY